MPFLHLLLALSVVFIWGTNFVVIKWGLAEFPPFLLATLRFVMCVVPWTFFIARPRVAWSQLALFGVLLGAGQFGLLFYAMRSDITPGLASLVIQSQVFFTIALSVLLKGERVSPAQLAGMALAVAGVALIGWQSLHAGAASVTLAGLGIVLTAACCWAVANMVVRRAGKVDPLAFIVWSSPFALPPLVLLSMVFDGTPAIVHALNHASLLGWAVVLWQALGNTLFGFAAWNWLQARHPAATVTPTALLVPVFGMSSSALLLAEPLPAWKLVAAALVIAGLGLNVYASSRPARVVPRRATA